MEQIRLFKWRHKYIHNKNQYREDSYDSMG